MQERYVWSFIRGGLALCLICLTGCQQEMANEPRYKPLAASTFFADGRASRDLVLGTVARGHEAREGPLYTGRVGTEEVTDLPLPTTPELLARGRERYNIYCTPCHDYVGTGHGMIVQRGYPHPPSFHIPRLRQAPIGHFFVVMTDGFGAMPGYASLVPLQDRWAIAAYIRALQLSQYAPVTALPAEARQQLEAVQ
jgi:hypothetical protein